MEHVGLSVLYMVGITVGILYMMSHDTNCGYKKILGLRGDRTGQGRAGQKRSLEARADAFSRLKKGVSVSGSYFQTDLKSTSLSCQTK